MLVWEDDLRSPQANLPRPLDAFDAASDRDARPVSPSPRDAMSAPVLTQAVVAAAAQITVPSKSTPAKSVIAQTARRVTAADKRIINGQTDVNQLVPFKYKWAW